MKIYTVFGERSLQNLLLGGVEAILDPMRG